MTPLSPSELEFAERRMPIEVEVRLELRQRAEANQASIAEQLRLERRQSGELTTDELRAIWDIIYNTSFQGSPFIKEAKLLYGHILFLEGK